MPFLLRRCRRIVRFCERLGPRRRIVRRGILLGLRLRVRLLRLPPLDRLYVTPLLVRPDGLLGCGPFGDAGIKVPDRPV